MSPLSMLAATVAESGIAGFLHEFETVFGYAINIMTHILEMMGVIVLVIGAFTAFIAYFQHKPDSRLRLALAKSMALALEFKLGGEILRTVVARNWDEILTVGAIIVLRCILNFMIHWEIGNIQHDNDVLDANTAGESPPPSKKHGSTFTFKHVKH